MEMTVFEALSIVDRYEIKLLKQGVHSVPNVGDKLYDECFGVISLNNGVTVRSGQIACVLEKAEKIHEFDLKMLGSVISDLHSNKEAVNGCNLSALNISNEKHWEKILNIITANKSVAKRLILEITETAPFKNTKLAKYRLNLLQQLGCRVAMDDFGVGYSTPKVMYDIDFDIIKVDASFLAVSQSENIKPLYNMVSLASDSCPVVVVEGVEDGDQLHLVAMCGATHAQGYYLSMPI